jgi:ribosomal protein L37AE/L43A
MPAGIYRLSTEVYNAFFISSSEIFCRYLNSKKRTLREMKKYEIKTSDDGNCPYCGSDYVMKTTDFSPGPDAELPAKVIVWKCYRCNKVFYCQNK